MAALPDRAKATSHGGDGGGGGERPSDSGRRIRTAWPCPDKMTSPGRGG